MEKIAEIPEHYLSFLITYLTVRRPTLVHKVGKDGLTYSMLIAGLRVRS